MAGFQVLTVAAKGSVVTFLIADWPHGHLSWNKQAHQAVHRM